MLKTLFQFASENDGNIAVDWVILAAGAVSLGMAVTLTATHNASAAPENPVADYTVASSAD